MPVFPIKWKLPFEAEQDERSRDHFKLKLSDEWNICVLLRKQRRGWNAVVNSIEIHRKNTFGDFLVSGELTLEKNWTALVTKKVSQVIKTGSSFTEICPRFFYEYAIDWTSCMNGFLNISEVNERQPTALTVKESKERIQLNSFEELSKNLERLLNSDPSCFADVTLKCDSVPIPAHKSIISARSPVFAAMFTHPMKESLKNEADITDIDVPTLRALLKYMYTGRTSDLTASSSADLLFAADKYQLPDLKAVCSYFLKETVTVENMWNILVLGDMHSEDLKSFVMDYICNKCGEFSVLENSQEWKALRKEKPDLAIELLESLVKYRDQKSKR